MTRHFIIAILLCITIASASAQELKCTVQLNAQKITGVDASTFQTLQNAITEFMNNRSWTQDQFSAEERIECSMTINLETGLSDLYSGSITIQSSRPIFNSSYTSPILNFRDQDFIFTYSPNTPLDFNVTQYNSNLTSVLAYYAYLIIGLDYESMSKGGGAKYLGMADQITNLIPSTAADAKGWKAFDASPVSGDRNRYYIINSLLGGKYEGFKQALYDYHYMGLDNFYDRPEAARANVLNALEKLDKAFKDNNSNVLIILFMQAKSDELVGIFSGAEQGEKLKAVTYLKHLDPVNGTKYDKILKG